MPDVSRVATSRTDRVRRRRLRGLPGALVVAVALAVVLAPSPASAHASLIASTPAQGDRLGALPSQVTFEFDQEMAAPAYVIVTAPDGTSVAAGEPEVDGTIVRQRLRDGQAGTYTMAYRAVSKDGHPLTGQISFTVGPAGEAPAAGQPTASPRPATTVATTTTPDGSWSRRTVGFAVGGGLFAAALLLLLLSRRAPP